MADAGRDPSTLQIVVLGTRATAEKLERFAAAGVTEVAARIPAGSADEILPALDALARAADDLEAAGVITPIHLMLAKVTTASYLAMVVTGVRTLRNRSRRRAHRIAAVIVLTLTVITAGTGVAMIAGSERLDPAPSAEG